MRTLIDMDGVIADFEKAFHTEWTQRYPDKQAIPLHERKHFKIRDDYPKDYRPLIDAIYNSEGFYRNLPPINGGKQALEELARTSEVYICTSPLKTNKHCMTEKYEW